jgi:hypothetical protein
MDTGDWWRVTQDHVPAGATVMLAIGASDKTHWNNSSSDQHPWLLYLMIFTIRKDIRWTCENPAWILFGLIPCPQKGSKDLEEAWHSAVGTVQSQPWDLDIAGPRLNWHCADEFQRKCYPLLAVWVGDVSEHIKIAQVCNALCLMCEILNVVPMVHFTFSPLNNSRDRHIYLELLEDNNNDALHILGVHPIRNQF